MGGESVKNFLYGTALLLGFLLGWRAPAVADGVAGFSLIVQQSGTTKGAAVTMNCSTNVTCSLSGGVVTLTASGSGGITALTQDVSASGSGSVSATVQGIEAVPFCPGYTPLNSQVVTYTTGLSPDPCYTATTPSAAGGSASYGTYASLPGTSTSGNLYAQTDGPYDFIANGSGGWEAFLRGQDGAAITLPVPSGYSWGNQPSGSSVTSTHGGEILTVTGSSGDNFATRIVEAVPSTPWSIQIAYQLTPWWADYGGSGVMAFNSTTGKGVVCGRGMGSSPFLQFQRLTSYTSVSTNPFQVGYVPGALLWIKMVNDGTNIKCSESTTGGVTWNQYYTETLATFYNGASVTSVGYGYDINNTALNGTFWLLHWLQGTN